VPDVPQIDPWSPLDYRDILGKPGHLLAPTWVNPEHHRRLTAYKVLAAYLNNTARTYASGTMSAEARAKIREYGDPDLLVDRVANAVLGENPEIVVDGANADLPDQPELPKAPAALPDNADPAAKRIHDILTARHTKAVDDAITTWAKQLEIQPGLANRQEQLRDWADTAHLAERMHEAEHDAVGLGDAVYVLVPLGAKGCRLDVYDPGFYFPVYDDASDEFPSKIHLGWEFERDDGAGKVTKLVRLRTWELVDSEPYKPAYAGPDDPQATQRCFYTDATWEVKDLGTRTAGDFDRAKATFATLPDGRAADAVELANPQGVGIDFIPAVHLPDTPAGKDHFGRSVLTIVAQLLDDLQNVDTDIAESADLVAGPMIGLTGVSMEEAQKLHVHPGAVFGLGQEGKLDTIDLSASLGKLTELVEQRLQRLSTNSRIPAEVLGRVKASDIASGFLLQLTFGPFTGLIDTLRLVRGFKYRLLLKMVQRLMITFADWKPPVVTARIAFGSYLPSDRAALVTEVTELLQAKAISHQTAVQLLVAGGLPIEDAQHEVDRIRADDPTAAAAVADATASEAAARDWLGLPPATNQPPDVNVGQ